MVRRRLEEEVGGLQAELEEVAVSRRQLEERWREAASEVARFTNLDFFTLIMDRNSTIDIVLRLVKFQL